MNIWELSNLIPRILTLLLVVDVLKLCYKVLLQRETAINTSCKNSTCPFRDLSQISFLPGRLLLTRSIQSALSPYQVL